LFVWLWFSEEFVVFFAFQRTNRGREMLKEMLDIDGLSLHNVFYFIRLHKILCELYVSFLHHIVRIGVARCFARWRWFWRLKMGGLEGGKFRVHHRYCIPYIEPYSIQNLAIDRWCLDCLFMYVLMIVLVSIFCVLYIF
jgi:hypothetical protein